MNSLALRLPLLLTVCFFFYAKSIESEKTLSSDMSPWSRKNLHDPATDAFYIPPHLWTGASWNGDKSVGYHEVDSRFMGDKTITGPVLWRHPFLNKEFKVYKRLNGDKEQLFTLYERGFERVYDSREQRYFSGGIKFPCGPGWKLGGEVEFTQSVWEKGQSKVRKVSITLKRMDFNDQNQFESMTYIYSVNGVPDHEYVYKPNRGLTALKKL